MAAGLGLLAGAAMAQDEAGRKMKLELERISTALGPLHAVGGIVKNAPFSGQEVRESNQVLADGTRIHNETKTSVYRDNEGRTRRENGDKVTIMDPVAGTTYILDTKAMTAEKINMGQVFYRTAAGPGMAAGGGMGMAAPKGHVTVKDGMVTVDRDGKTETFPLPDNGEWNSPDGKMHLLVRKGGDVGSTETVSTARMIDGHTAINKDGNTETLPLPPEGNMIIAEKLKAEMAASAGVPGVPIHRPNVKGEELGEQTIEGVKARGVRNTSTVEIGAIGNDRPLTTLSESWYSDELKTEVMSRRNDPRTGESNFRLTNINRGEPASYLFQVPSGYTVTERK
jgi:hypothetical protein